MCLHSGSYCGFAACMSDASVVPITTGGLKVILGIAV